MSHPTKNKTALAIAMVIGATSVCFSATSAASPLTIASWGGAYEHAQSEALFKPAAKALGIKIKEVTYGGMQQVRLQVKTGAVTYDIVSSGFGSCEHAAAQGLLEPLNYKEIDVSHFYPGTYSKYCVGSDTFSNVIAWSTKTYGKNGPQSWADFWNVKKFPGKRAYRGNVGGALEPALMADGVPPDQVYKVLSTKSGVERAINKIRQLKPYISVWWKSGSQQAQLLQDGEVDMTTGWNGRFDVANQHGAKIMYTYNQGILDYDVFSIPKGAPHKAEAMKFLAEISKAKYEANLPKYITYGPTNKKAYEIGKISKSVAEKLPSYPANAAKQIQLNHSWYKTHKKEAETMYRAMMLQ